MREKMKIIQEIKAAESSSLGKSKLVDLAKSQGYGFLSEMSIAELQERLELARQEKEEWNKQRHDEIVKSKMQKEEALVDKLHFINKFKRELNKPRKM
jgi:hypothetical protein